MDSIKNIDYTTVVNKDIKLKKWAIGFFSIVSFIVLISLFFGPDIPVSTPLVYLIYVIVTIYVLRFTKADLFSPLMWFLFFSWLGYGLSMPVLLHAPDTVFFVDPFYTFNFRYDSYTIATAFAVFLVGYVSFIIGFYVVKRGIKINIPERPVDLSALALLTFVLIVVTYYFRSHFNVGVVGHAVADIPHAGYIFFPLTYGTVLALGFTMYTALLKNSSFYVFVSIVLFGIWSLSLAVLGWKSGPVQAVMIMATIYYYVSRYRQPNLNNKIKKILVVTLLLSIVATIMLFGIIDHYRAGALMVGYQASWEGFSQAIARTDFSAVFEKVSSVFRRVSGLNNLVPITAYLHQGWGELSPDPSFWANLFGDGIHPETYYTWYILGVNPNILTTNAPTSWGAWYIYGGLGAVIAGMMFIGMLSKVLYLVLMVNLRRNGWWVVFYTLFMVLIFLAVVFEGTMVNHFRRHFIALVVMYSFFVFILYITPYFTLTWVKNHGRFTVKEKNLDKRHNNLWTK